MITLLTSSPVVALLGGRPSPVDEVLSAPRVRGVRSEVVAGPPDDRPELVEALCAGMRARAFDLAVQLHGGGGNANPLLLRSGARVTAGSRAPGSAALDRNLVWTFHQHDLMRWLEVLGLVGAEPVRLRPQLTVTPADPDAPVLRPGLPALVGLLERADLLVGNDSGPRHIAEAVGTVTVGVFTRANLVDVAPLFRARHRVAVSFASACTRCGRDAAADPCGHGATVLGDVTVDEVVEAAAALLDEASSAAPDAGLHQVEHGVEVSGG